MVLQQTQRHPATQSRLDPNRILGISSTMALNVLALLALLIPMNLPAPIALPDPDPELRWIDPPKKQIVKPVEATIVPPQPTQKPVERTRTITPPAEDHVVIDAGTLPADTALDLPAADIAPPTIAPPSGPIEGVRLEYADASAPGYPRDAIRDQLEGTVMLRVLVDTDGKPLEVRVHQSSGHRVLDQAAVRHVMRHWTFRPASKDGHVVQAIGIVPIDFRLDRM